MQFYIGNLMSTSNLKHNIRGNVYCKIYTNFNIYLVSELKKFIILCLVVV